MTAWKRGRLAGILVVVAGLLLSACGGGGEEGGKTPAPKEVPGVTDTEILLGTHLPLSQSPAAAYSPIGNGMQAYFDYINDVEGGVNGRKIRLIIGDDHYNPPDTAEITRRLVEQDKVFAMIGGLGTATHSAVWKYLEENGVPDVGILSGAVQWTDPVVKTRFGGIPDYVTEGRALGKYVVEKYDGKKLGFILQNDDFGADGEKGVKQSLEGSKIQIVARETYEATQSDLTSQVQRVKNAGAEVLVIFALPPQAANAVKVAREVLSWDAPIIMTTVSASDITIALAGAKNMEGVVSAVYGYQMFDTDKPGIQKHIEIMKKYGKGTEASNFTVAGAAIAELAVEGLKRAGPNLTRQSFVEALESIRGFNCSTCFAPISLSPKDHRPSEAERYVVVRNGTWESFGEIISYESTKE